MSATGTSANAVTDVDEWYCQYTVCDMYTAAIVTSTAVHTYYWLTGLYAMLLWFLLLAIILWVGSINRILCLEFKIHLQYNYTIDCHFTWYG